MGIILGALAGAGDYIAKSETQNQKRMDDMDLEKHRSDLEMRKLKMLDSLRERSAIATEQRAEEPLKRFGTALAANQQGEVPVTAAPVTSLAGKQGQNTDGNGLVSGFTGGLEKIKADILAMPEGADKTQAIAQLQSQFAAETETANKGIIGQTRKITSDEALNKTLGETMASDPVALAAYEKNIGKSARDDRRIDVTQARDEARGVASAKESERKEKSAERRDETQRYIAQLRADTTERTAELRINALVKSSGGGSNGTKEALSFIDGARKELANDAANLKAMYIADTKDVSSKKLEAIKAEYKPKQDALDAKRAQIESDFGTLREKVGLPTANRESPRPAAAPAPAPAATKTDKPAAPAPAAKAASPYAEGTKLTGPGGKPYIVRNGKPEPV